MLRALSMVRVERCGQEAPRDTLMRVREDFCKKDWGRWHFLTRVSDLRVGATQQGPEPGPSSKTKRVTAHKRKSVLSCPHGWPLNIHTSKYENNCSTGELSTHFIWKHLGQPSSDGAETVLRNQPQRKATSGEVHLTLNFGIITAH